MKLFLVRHGQSFNNTLPDGKGRVADPPLTAIGERQAPQVAQYLANGAAKDPYNEGGSTSGFGITRLFTSAHLRCLQTSAPIAEALNLDPEIWVDVHEECGIWLDGHPTMSGMTRLEIAEQFPRVVIPDEIGKEGWWNRPRETEAEWVARADRVADQLWREFADTDEHLAIVAHGGFIKDLVSALIAGGPLEKAMISCRNTSITNFNFSEGELVVGYVNRVDHLSPELVT
jgi:broad specificity phosphatase PhoE